MTATARPSATQQARPARAGAGWLRCRQPRPHARVRLVCLPHAGGSAGAFRAWSAHLPESVELHAVQYPGREDRYHEPAVTDLHRLADLVAGALIPLLDRPLALFGHSMGAIVAHETALRLHRRGTPLSHLFLSGQPAPGHRQGGTVHLGDDDTLVSELRRLGGTRQDALDDPELRAIVLPAVRADYQAVETYRPANDAPLSCPITAFVGTEDPEATVPETRDWASQTTGPFDLRALPGGHFYLTDHTATVATDVARRLGTPWPDLP